MPDPELPSPPTREDLLRIYLHAVPLQARTYYLADLLGPVEGKECLALSRGGPVTGLLLRERGGEWTVLDYDPMTHDLIRSVAGSAPDPGQSPGRLPFDDASFACVVVTDLFTDLADESALVEEIHRVLQPAGLLVLDLPHTKTLGLGTLFRRMFGRGSHLEGRARRGYSGGQLFEVLKTGFDVQRSRTYSRVFSEWADVIAGEPTRDPDPLSAGRRMARWKWMYWLAAQADLLVFFTRGYRLSVRARRRLWKPRQTPRLRDGRSIAEAAINTKIGTAAPF